MTPLPWDREIDFREELPLAIIEIMKLEKKLRLKLREFERFEKKNWEIIEIIENFEFEKIGMIV